MTKLEKIESENPHFATDKVNLKSESEMIANHPIYTNITDDSDQVRYSKEIDDFKKFKKKLFRVREKLFDRTEKIEKKLKKARFLFEDAVECLEEASQAVDKGIDRLTNEERK